MSTQPPTRTPKSDKFIDNLVESKQMSDAGIVGSGAPTFIGWVGFAEGASTFRVYTDPWLQEWYEVPTAGLVAQTSGSERRDEGRSCVWVHAEAIVKHCKLGKAAMLADLELQGHDYDDPAGGTPYGGSKPPRRP